MKKSLIALAALASVAGVAQAQSSVTVYGVLDAGYSETSKTIAGQKNSQSALSFNNFTSSRLGVKGTEDLGAGLKANFVIETGISSNPMAGFSQTNSSASTKNGTTLDATTLGSRELNASIENSAGTSVKLGYGSTAIRDTVLGFDAAYGSNLVGNVLTNDAQFSSNRSTAAGVAQKLGDFTVGAALTKNNDETATTTTKTGSGYIANLGYAKGALAFGAAYQSSKTKTNAVAQQASGFTLSETGTACATGYTDVGDVSNVGNTTTRNICALNAVAATDKTVKTTVIGTSYDFGIAKAYVSYGEVKTDDTVTADAVGEGKRSAYSVGIRVPVAKATLFAQYSDGSKTEVVTAGTAAVKRDWNGISAGAVYALSKRTSAYAAYGQTTLDGTSGNTNSLRVQQVAAGIAHSF
jgi:predicted porin